MSNSLPENVKSVSLIEYGAMSNDVYADGAINPPLEKWGWERVISTDLNDFRARLYAHKSGHTVLAYRGTDFSKWSNLEANYNLVLKQHSIFLDYAEKAYESACKEHTPPMAVVGHSLGGYLAQYVSIMARHKVVGDPAKKSTHLKEHKQNDAALQKCIAAQSGDKKISVPQNYLPYAITFNTPHVGGLRTRLDFVIESADHHSYILNCRLLGGDPVPYFGERTGLEDTLSPLLYCSSQESKNSMWNPGNYIPAFKAGAMAVVCARQSHSMNAVMERLQAEGAIKKEKLGLSILPIRS